MTDIKQAVELARDTGDLPMLDFYEGDVLDARDAANVERYEMAVINMRTTILAMHATIVKQARVVEASKALRLAEATLLPGESIAELEQASKAREARTQRALTVWRTAIDAMADAEGGGA